MQSYNEFVDKFKPRHTSDDTHTPPNVYEAVLSWCVSRYGIDRAKVVRPFFPGGDYAHAEYPADCMVVDNPPFSILSQIIRFYLGRKIPFFLFAPSLTCLGYARHPGCAAIFSNSDITFDNGAVVRCAFLTSLEGPDVLAVSAPDLGDAIAVAEKENRKTIKKHVTPLALPTELITGVRMQHLASHHTPFTVRRSEAVFVRKLDGYPGGVYGGGFLLAPRAAAERAAAERAAAERAAAERAAAERAAAERAAAHKVELSPRERAICNSLGNLRLSSSSVALAKEDASPRETKPLNPLNPAHSTPSTLLHG